MSIAFSLSLNAPSTHTPVAAPADVTPPTITSPAALVVASGISAVGTLTADELVGWGITGGEDAHLFQMSGAALSFAATPTGGVYRVEVTATDAGGNTATQALTVTVAAAQPASSDEIVFVLSIGQSNADGRGDPADLIPGTDYPAGVLYAANDAGTTSQANVGDVTSGYVTEMLGFATDYVAIHPDPTLVFAQIAAGGSGFSNNRWNPGDDLYNAAVSRANGVMAALQAANPTKTVRFGGFVWQQGELDRNNPGYEAALDAMIAAMRSDIADADATTPFLLGEPSGSAQYDAVRAVILDTPNRIDHTAAFRSTGAALNDGDATHFSALGLLTLGRRAVRALEVAAANTSDDNTDTENTDADNTAPVITSPVSVSLANGATAVMTLAADEPATWLITGGADQALFALAGADLSFASPQTTAGDYVVAVSATDASGNSAGHTITVSVAAASDTTPEAFTFTDVAAADPSTVYSAAITVAGINAAAPISVAGGDYRIDGGAWTAASGTVLNGAVVAVRVTSSASDGATVAATLTIGGVSDTFAATTAAAASDAEAGAAGHWFFGSDNTAMADLTSGQTLTTMALAPTHSAGYLTLGDDGGATINGLQTPIDDPAALTYCAVVRVGSADIPAMVGPTFGESSGEGFYFHTLSGGTLKANSRSGGKLGNANVESPFEQDVWMFVALAADGTNTTLALSADGANGHNVVTKAAGRAQSSNKVALGNAYYDAHQSFAGGIDVAELIVFDAYRTQSEIEAIYARSVARLAARGIVVR